MHNVTVVCQSCGKEFTYRTMFISTVGVAVCALRRARRTSDATRKTTPPLDVEVHDHSEPAHPAGSRRGGLT